MTRPLAVLAVAPYVPEPVDHGGRLRTRLLLTELQRRGHRVRLLALAADPAEAERAQALTAAGLPTETLLVPRRFGRLRLRDRLLKLACLFTGRSDLLRRFTARRLPPLGPSLPDVVLAEVLWALPTALRLPGHAYVLDAHNVESHVQALAARAARGATGWLARLEARHLARAEQRLAGRCDALAVVSTLDAERFRRLGVTRPLRVVPNAVEAALSPPLPPPLPGPYTCLFVGSLQYAPNADAVRYLAGAILPRLREALPGVRCRVAGGGAPPDLRPVPGLELLGYVPDLVPLYREAHAVLAPIRVGGGTRTKILEAFAYGRPVVATPLGVEGLAVEPEVHYLAADQPEAFAGALRRLAREPELWARLVRNARAFAEREAHPARAGAALADLLEEVRAGKLRAWTPS